MTRKVRIASLSGPFGAVHDRKSATQTSKKTIMSAYHELINWRMILRCHQEPVTCLLTSGDWLWSGDEGGHVVLSDLRKGRSLVKIQLESQKASSILSLGMYNDELFWSSRRSTGYFNVKDYLMERIDASSKMAMECIDGTAFQRDALDTVTFCGAFWMNEYTITACEGGFKIIKDNITLHKVITEDGGVMSLVVRVGILLAAFESGAVACYAWSDSEIKLQWKDKRHTDSCFGLDYKLDIYVSVGVDSKLVVWNQNGFVGEARLKNQGHAKCILRADARLALVVGWNGGVEVVSIREKPKNKGFLDVDRVTSACFWQNQILLGCTDGRVLTVDDPYPSVN